MEITINDSLIKQKGALQLNELLVLDVDKESLLAGTCSCSPDSPVPQNQNLDFLYFLHPKIAFVLMFLSFSDPFPLFS